MLAAGLAIGSSITGGISDFLGGTTSRQIGTMRFMFASQLIGLACITVWVIAAGEALPGVTTIAAAAGAGVALTVGLGVFLQAMVIGTVSIVAPVSATGVVVPIAAGVIGGDRPSVFQAVGIVLATGGIVLVARSSRPERESPRQTGLWLALVSAVGVGVFFWLMAVASRHAAPWGLLIARLVPTLAFVIALWVREMPLGPTRAHVPATVLAALLGFVSMSMYAFATKHGQLAIVSVLASLFPGVTIVLAYFVLGERLASTQRTGVGAVLVGVVLMASG